MKHLISQAKTRFPLRGSAAGRGWFGFRPVRRTSVSGFSARFDSAGRSSAHCSAHLQSENGAVTAELAVGFPVVVLLLVVVLTLAAASGAQLRALDAARAGARALAIGQTETQVSQTIQQVAGVNASWELTRQAGWVRVEVAKPVLAGWLSRAPLRAHGEAFAWVEP